MRQKNTVRGVHGKQKARAWPVKQLFSRPGMLAMLAALGQLAESRRPGKQKTQQKRRNSP